MDSASIQEKAEKTSSEYRGPEDDDFNTAPRRRRRERRFSYARTLAKKPARRPLARPERDKREPNEKSTRASLGDKAQVGVIAAGGLGSACGGQLQSDVVEVVNGEGSQRPQAVRL